MIGVRLSDVEPDQVKAYKLSKPEGAVVEAVNPNSPAATAGLRDGDVIRLGETTLVFREAQTSGVRLAEHGPLVQGSISIPAQDLLTAVCHKGTDTLIADAASAQVAKRLPPWLQRSGQARTFLLLPLVMKGATFALIYADRSQAGSIAAGEKELSLLRTLRSQAVMAFRQAS